MASEALQDPASAWRSIEHEGMSPCNRNVLSQNLLFHAAHHTTSLLRPCRD